MPNETTQFERLRIVGYKSFVDTEIDFGSLNVVIGANGAGKTNLISFFSLLKAALAGKLDGYVGRHGGPNSLLHMGPKSTNEIRCEMVVNTEAGRGAFFQRFEFQAPDNLIYGNNPTGTPPDRDRSNEVIFDDICGVVSEGGPGGHPGHLIYDRLQDGIGVYHFHDTTLTAPVRSSCYVEDNRRLHADGGNLAAFLHRLKKSQSPAYKRIVSTVRLIAPFFEDFHLAPKALDPTRILLNWQHVDSQREFGPHQLSDGTIRAICLISLLLQPKTELPSLIIVDEPELGLHPYALNVVASLFQEAAHHTQILIGTQSSTLLDSFSPENVIVAERNENATALSRPDPEAMTMWLEQYSLGEIWEKNVIGGGPH